VKSIDPEQKNITDKNGNQYSYEKLLLATGGVNRRLPISGKEIIYYRTVEDFKKLKKLTESKRKFGVIGMGFIGSEISAALASNGLEVTVFDIGAGIGWNIFPSGLTEHLNEYFRKKNVNVIPNVKVKAIEKIDEVFTITTDSGIAIAVDGVVAGIGIVPDVKLTEGINLMLKWYKVNEYLQTARSDIYAAGDVANFYNPLLGKRIRVEHSDNAKAMGKQGGEIWLERMNYMSIYHFSTQTCLTSDTKRLALWTHDLKLLRIGKRNIRKGFYII
jgi:NADPH-dependent 2,4-dienoyl-CoA reductase/sulfur reductase-like enzyme